MFFSENPFYRQGVHSTDAMAELMTRERACKGETEKVEDLRFLLQGENRAEAEFYWLMGWEKKDAFHAVKEILAGKVHSRNGFEKRSVHSRIIIELNEMAMGHMSLPRLLEIEKDFAALSPLDVAACIEKDRQRAGFPSLQEPWIIEMWKQDLLMEIGRAASVSLLKLSPADHGTLLAGLHGKGQRGMVYYQLLSDFEKRKSAPAKIPQLAKQEKGKRNIAAWGGWVLLAGILASGLVISNQ